MTAFIHFALSERIHSPLGFASCSISRTYFINQILPMIACPNLSGTVFAPRVKRSNFNIFNYLDKTHSNFKVTVAFWQFSPVLSLPCYSDFYYSYKSTLLPFWESKSSEFYRVLSTKKESDLINCSHIIIGFGYYCSSNKGVYIF